MYVLISLSLSIYIYICVHITCTRSSEAAKKRIDDILRSPSSGKDKGGPSKGGFLNNVPFT